MKANQLFKIGSVRYTKTRQGFRISGIGTLLFRRSVPFINLIQVRDAGIRYGVIRPYSNQKKGVSRQRISTEIQKKSRRRPLSRILLLFTVILVLLITVSDLPPTLILVAAVSGLLIAAVARSYHAIASSTILLYQLDRRSQTEYRKFVAAFQTLKQCETLWFTDAAQPANNLNATTAADGNRIVAILRKSMPAGIESNITAPMLYSTTKQMVFLPDALLIIGKQHVVMKPYSALRVVSRMLRVVEESKDAVPSDARIVDNTWKHVNDDGTPDPNYKENPERPIVLYGEIIITGDEYFEEVIRISKSREADDFVVDFERYLANFRQHARRK